MKRLLLICGALLACALPSLAQVQPVALPGFQYFDNDGHPLAGGKICTYSGGTTSFLPTYTDSTKSTQNADPLILDSAGRGTMWFDAQSYKVVVRTAGSDGTCSTGTIIRSDDNIPGAGQSVASQAFSAVTAGTNSNAGTFAMSGNTLDLSAATFKSPTGAGAAPTTSGLISYDTTANKFVFGVNGATKSFALASTGACSAGQFVSSPATAIAVAGCSPPSLAGSTCSGCTINGSSTISSSALTADTIGSSTMSSSFLDGNRIATAGAAGQSHLYITYNADDSYIGSGQVHATGYEMRTGTNGSYQGHNFQLSWDGADLHLWYDDTDLGKVCFKGQFAGNC